MRLVLPLFAFAMLAQQPEKATPNLARPQEPDGFKGIKFGATEEQAKSVVGPIFCMGGRRVGRMCVLNIHIADESGPQCQDHFLPAIS